jgi:DNA polymerase-3 subunit delta
MPKGGFMTITLSGANDYRISEELRKLLSNFISVHGDMAVEKLFADEADYQKIYDALTSLPFLSDKKMVILWDPSANKQFVEKAEYLIENIADSTDVVFVERKIDKRLSLYKLLKKQTDYREFPELDENQLASWLVEQAKTQKAQISVSDARFLVERLGTNQQMLSSELNKVALYDKNITKKSIEINTEAIPQSSIFELLDSVFSGDSKRALTLYREQRALQVEPIQIISMLVWQFQIVALIKASKGLTSDQIARESKNSPYTVAKTMRIASKISLTQLRRMIHDLLELDVKRKTQKIDDDEALQHYILSIYNK